MNIFSKMSNGWQLAKSCIKVLNTNKQLIIFPILSGLFLLLLTAGFIAVNPFGMSGSELFLFAFLYYIITYFIVVFFNMALIHCARLYFEGEQVSITKGLQFSVSRIRVIFLWAVFAATVGVILKTLQDNLGLVGRLITTVIGIVWSVATFLVVPVLAYENLGPADAVKRSAQLMTKKWGDGIGANFSFAIIFMIPVLILCIIAAGISSFNDQASIILMVASMAFALIISNAFQSILISALYSSINGNTNLLFKEDVLDNTFGQK